MARTLTYSSERLLLLVARWLAHSLHSCASGWELKLMLNATHARLTPAAVCATCHMVLRKGISPSISFTVLWSACVFSLLSAHTRTNDAHTHASGRDASSGMRNSRYSASEYRVRVRNPPPSPPSPPSPFQWRMDLRVSGVRNWIGC